MTRSFHKSLPLVLALSLTALAGPALAQKSENTAEKAWDATKDGTEKAWDATKSGTKKGWDATKRGTKKATKAAGNAGDAAIEGTRKTGEKIADKLPPDPAKKP